MAGANKNFINDSCPMEHDWPEIKIQIYYSRDVNK